MRASETATSAAEGFFGGGAGQYGLICLHKPAATVDCVVLLLLEVYVPQMLLYSSWYSSGAIAFRLVNLMVLDGTVLARPWSLLYRLLVVGLPAREGQRHELRESRALPLQGEPWSTSLTLLMSLEER